MNAFPFADSSSIVDLHDKFVKLCTDGILDIEIFSFLEMKSTELSIFYLRIIDFFSGGKWIWWWHRFSIREMQAFNPISIADPGIGDVCGLPLDHFNICKPRHRKCILYKQLIEMIATAIKKS